MISISKLGGSGQASSYYEKADYYTKGEDGVDISSSFQGKLAEEFGLEGSVDKEKFKDLLDGKIPTGGQLGTRRNGKLEHTPGWDLTFSAPKSVSILGLIGDDKSVIKAHHKAVESTLGYLERDMIKTRVNKSDHKGEAKIDKALFAKFTHTTSRKLDPQLHTHSVLLNMGKDEFGDIKSIDSRGIYDKSMMLGQMYRNELAKGIMDLGYAVEWDGNTGLFEVKGIPKELIDNFSKRREEIVKVAGELGIESAKGMDKVTVGTRDKKVDIGKSELLDGWDKETERLGFKPSEISHSAIKSAKESKLKPLRGMMGNVFVSAHKSERNAVDYAVEHLSYYEAAFREKDLITEALKFSSGEKGYGYVKDVLDQMKRKGEVIESNKVEGFVTTKEAIRQENYILSVEKDNRGSVSALASMEDINSKMNEYEFTDGQKGGFVHLLRNEDRFTAIQGHAGVGKTYMLKPYVEMAKKAGFEVRGVAPMGKAAGELRDSIGVETNTLASLLNDLDKENSKQKDKVTLRPHENRIYIVDEASSINSRDMADLVTQVSRNGGRVIFTGDRVQLGGVERGKTFAQLQDNGMSTSVNTDIVRQRNSPRLLSAIESGYAREFEKTFDLLAERIVEEESKDRRLEQFVDDYVRLSAGDKKHLAVVMDNETRKKATELIRSEFRKDGRIEKSELVIKALENAKVDGAKKSLAQYYEEGMKVRFLEDYKRLGVKKDSYFTVMKSNTREVILGDGKRQFKWNPDKIAGNKKKGGVVAYKEEEKHFSVGDVVRFKDRNNQEGYVNGNIGKVIAIKDGKMDVEMDKKGSVITIDPSNMRHRHLEHGYIDTAYVSQGATSYSAQVMAESYRKNLLNDSSFIVGITRPEQDIRLYVDSKSEVLRAVKEKSGTKQGALDHTHNRPDSYKPYDNKSTNVKQKTDQVQNFTTFVSDENKVSKSADITKQVDREKTFLP